MKTMVLIIMIYLGDVYNIYIDIGNYGQYGFQNGVLPWFCLFNNNIFHI